MEALDWLIPGSATDVLEIGAGTGILTRLLAERVHHVIAVEPDARMRAVLAAHNPMIEVLAGHAEEIPAAASSVDLIIAQSAWHWVDEERAVPEVVRVLRPGGRLSLVWTGPDRTVDWMRSLWAGGIIFSPEEQSDEDNRRKRRHLVNVDLGGESAFFAARDRPLPVDPADATLGSGGALGHVQRGHHHGGERPPRASRSNDAISRLQRGICRP